MHYYQHNIGDYRRDTVHLSLLEHGIYRQLIDNYYLYEEPLTLDLASLMRSQCVRNADEVQAFENVLKDFFRETEKGYVHKRCDESIAKFHEKRVKAKASADARWSKNKDLDVECKRDANALQTQCEGNANSLTHKLNKKNKDIVRENFTPDDFLLAKHFDLNIKKLTGSKKKTNLEKWADSIRVIRDRDKHLIDEIRELFDWANKNDFWQSNIRSPDKLRKHWDALTIQFTQSKTANVQGQSSHENFSEKNYSDGIEEFGKPKWAEKLS